MIHLHDRACGKVVLKELHSGRHNLLELPNIRCVDDEGDDVGERAARTLHDRRHISDGLPDLLGHVSRPYQLSVLIPRKLPRQKDQGLGLIDANEVMIDGLTHVGKTRGVAARDGGQDRLSSSSKMLRYIAFSRSLTPSPDSRSTAGLEVCDKGQAAGHRLLQPSTGSVMML